MLTSVAEIITEGRNPSEGNRDDALKLFQEALELFQSCLDVQEFNFSRAQEQENEPPGAEPSQQQDHPNPPDPGTTSSNVSETSETEVWATIVEPITKDILLDTCLAQIGTLTALCNLESSQNHPGLPWVEQYYRSTLLPKVSAYVDSPARKHEAALENAKFTSALSDAAYRTRAIDLPTYERELNSSFNNSEVDLASDPQGLCDRADAELMFNMSIEASLNSLGSSITPEGMAQLNVTRWKHLTRAVDSLTSASKLPSAKNLARIHLRRGDCELLRLKLGETPTHYELARKSATTLLNNAGIYYKNALAATGTVVGFKDTGDEQKEAVVREAVVIVLKGDGSKLRQLVTEDAGAVEGELEDMRGDGLLGVEAWERIRGLV